MIPITLIKLPILLVKTTYFFVANFVKGTIDLAHLFNVIGIIMTSCPLMPCLALIQKNSYRSAGNLGCNIKNKKGLSINTKAFLADFKSSDNFCFNVQLIMY